MFDLTITFLFSYLKAFSLHNTKCPFNMNLKVSWKNMLMLLSRQPLHLKKYPTSLVEAPCRIKLDYK